MAVIHLAGSPALSPARLAKRLVRLRAANPWVTDADARFVHFVHLEGDPDLIRSRLAQRRGH